MKRLYPISMAIYRKKESKSQNIKLISILFSFQLEKNIFRKYSNFFGDNPGTNQNFVAHVL